MTALPSKNHEESNEREVDQSKRNSLSALRVAFGDSSVLRTSHTQDEPSDDHCRVVLLPLLLFCVLRDRALCRPELPVFGASIFCSLPDSEKKAKH